MGKEEITLASYLKENRDLLTILGIFIGIAAFSGNLGVKLIATFISFFSFTCATLVLMEFWRRQPKQVPKLPLTIRLFQFTFSCLALSFFLYWFTVSAVILPGISILVFIIIFIEVLIGYVEKKIVPHEKKKVVAGIVVIAVLTLFVVFQEFIRDVIVFPISKAALWIIEVSSKIQGPIQ